MTSIKMNFDGFCLTLLWSSHYIGQVCTKLHFLLFQWGWNVMTHLICARKFQLVWYRERNNRIWWSSSDTVAYWKGSDHSTSYSRSMNWNKLFTTYTEITRGLCRNRWCLFGECSSSGCRDRQPNSSQCRDRHQNHLFRPCTNGVVFKDIDFSGT